MDTTTAAAKASVSTATIRTWCRRNVIAAAKTAGKWDIDEASLAHRIALTAPAPKPVVFNTETMTAIGGSRWTKAGHDRVYLNDWADLAGLEISRYNTGNISSAAWQGEGISNSQAAKILACVSKVYFDAADGKLHCQYGGYDEPRIGRDEVWSAIVSGVRTAIAAL